MVAKRDNVVGQRVQAPAHGHNPLEIMTQQDYTQHSITLPPELVASLRYSSGPARLIHSPTSWRLARRNGELILQAGSIWTQGREAGIEWNDMPIVDLDELEGAQ